MYNEIFFHQGKKSLISPCVLIWSLENMVAIGTLLTSSEICCITMAFVQQTFIVKHLPIPHFIFATGK